MIPVPARIAQRPARPWPHGYVPIWAAAAYVGRSEATIREWARHDKVPSQRYEGDGELLVELPAVVTLDQQTPRRNGGRNQHAAKASHDWAVDKMRALNARSA